MVVAVVLVLCCLFLVDEMVDEIVMVNRTC